MHEPRKELLWSALLLLLLLSAYSQSGRLHAWLAIRNGCSKKNKKKKKKRKGEKMKGVRMKR
jgi:uncharacterized protein YaiI (UPF0178 family)